MHGGVLAGFLKGHLQVLGGLIQLVHPVISPADAVKISAVVRVLIERLLDHCEAFGHAHVFVYQHVAQIIQRACIIRVRLENLLELSLGRIKILLLLEHRPTHESDGVFLVGGI